MSRKRVAVDIDGVLAQYDDFKGLDIIGDPVPGAKEFLEKLLTKFEVILHSTRLSVDEVRRHGLDKTAGELKEIVESWASKHTLPYTILWMGRGKPRAEAYIDDRGIRCRPQENPMAFVEALTLLGIEE